MISLDRETRTLPPNGGCDSEQPAWRKEFPIDVPQDNYVARRDFTKFLGLTSLAFAAGQIWIAVQQWLRGQEEAPPRIRIGAVDGLSVGQSMMFSYPDPTEPCILTRTGERTFVAYNQKCTHLSCAVVPDSDHGRLHCPCHHGVFDLETGRPISGPPRRPLARILLAVEGDEIFAVGVELRTV